MEKKQQRINKKSKVESRKSKFPSLRSAVCGLPPTVSPPRSSVFVPHSAFRTPHSQAFTLIELLVAMGILMVIVLMLSNLFQASTRSWDTGMRSAEIGLEARAAINIIQQDLSQAVGSTNYPYTTMNFFVLSGSSTNDYAIEEVTYSVGNNLSRNGVELLRGVDSFDLVPVYTTGSAPEPPDYVEIRLTMKASKDYSDIRVYAQGRQYQEGGTDWVDTHRGN